ncbi:MAG: hypothetical protein KatS3mg016_0445 [Fimbriimonadales bacterium]|nr:MAG: hypothetical protein KatS3mg016_0445 [Fimbriimonadales bacterium]
MKKTHVIKRVALISPYAPSIVSFRGALIRDLIAHGAEVFVLAPDYTPEIRQAVATLGATPIDYPLNRTGMNPFLDLRTLSVLRRILRRLHPDVVVPYNIKPVIYGTLAAAFGVPVVATATGGLADQVRQMNGVLVPPNDPHALTQGILQAYGQVVMMPPEWNPQIMARDYWTMYQYAYREGCCQ